MRAFLIGYGEFTPTRRVYAALSTCIAAILCSCTIAAAQSSAWVEVCSSEGNTVNIRSGPGTDHQVIASLENATPLSLRNGNPNDPNSWLEVSLGNGYQIEYLGRDIVGFVFARLTTQGMCQVLHDPAVADLPSSVVGGRPVTLGPWDETHDLHLNYAGHPESARPYRAGIEAMDAILAEMGMTWDAYPDDTEAASATDGLAANNVGTSAATGVATTTTVTTASSDEIAARMKDALERFAEASSDMLTLRSIAPDMRLMQAAGGHFAAYERAEGGLRILAALPARYAPLVETHPPSRLVGFGLLGDGSILRLDGEAPDFQMRHFAPDGRFLREVPIPGGALPVGSLYQTGDGRVIVIARTPSGDLDVYIFDGAELEHQMTVGAGVSGSPQLIVENLALNGRTPVGYFVLRRRYLATTTNPEPEWEYFAMSEGRVQRVHQDAYGEGRSVYGILDANGPWVLGLSVAEPRFLMLMSPGGVVEIGASTNRHGGWGDAVSANGRVAWLEGGETLVIASNTGVVEERIQHNRIMSNPFVIGDTVVVASSRNWAVAVDGEIEIVGPEPRGAVHEVTGDRLVLRSFSRAAAFTIDF
jgi:hypothetical protein